METFILISQNFSNSVLFRVVLWNIWPCWSLSINFRMRTCTAPVPSSGGLYCKGKDQTRKFISLIITRNIVFFKFLAYFGILLINACIKWPTVQEVHKVLPNFKVNTQDGQDFLGIQYKEHFARLHRHATLYIIKEFVRFENQINIL